MPEPPCPGRLRRAPLRRPSPIRRRLVCLVAGMLGAVSACSIPANDLHLVSAELARRTGTGVSDAPPGEVSIPPGVSLDDGLDEKEAVAVALWNNAAFHATLADLGLARADIVQVSMIPNPPLSVFIPIGPKPLEVTSRFPLEVLWLRPRRRAIAAIEYQRTADRLVQSGLDLVRDVRVAFAELELAQQRQHIALEADDLARQVADLTDARLAAGDLSELESTTARVDSLQAREQVVRSGQDVDVARERFAYLIGLPRAEYPVAIAPSAETPQVGTDPAELVDTALSMRPDLHAAELAVETAGKRIGLARAEVFAIAAGVSAKEVGNDFLTGPTVDLVVPIFNQNQGGVALAEATVAKAARQYVDVRDRITWEVRDAHVRARQAQQSAQAWREQIVPSLEESVHRAERAYAAGDASFLFVLDTSRKLTDARGRGATAATDLRRAVAELERNVGYPLALNDAGIDRDVDGVD